MHGVGSAIRRCLSSPLTYGAWAAVVVITLLGTYPVDPFMFGVATLVVAWLTGAVSIVAIGALALWGSEWSRARRLLVATLVAIAVAAVARAFALLRTFSWT